LYQGIASLSAIPVDGAAQAFFKIHFRFVTQAGFSSPQALKRGSIFNVLAAGVKLVPFPVLITGSFSAANLAVASCSSYIH
jgi:hypothetical protein